MEEEVKNEEEQLNSSVTEENHNIETSTSVTSTEPVIQVEEQHIEENNIVENSSLIEEPNNLVEQTESVNKVEVPVETNQTYNNEEQLEEDYKIDNTEKKGKGPFLLIILALLIVGVLVSVFLLLNSSKKENKGRIEYELNNPNIQKIIKPFLYGGNHCFFFGEKLNNDSLIRLRVAYESIPSLDVINCNEVGGLLKYKNENGVLVLNAYCGSYPTQGMTDAYSRGDLAKFEEESEKNTTYGVTASKLKEQYYKIFSDNYSYKDESFGMGSSIEPYCTLMSYDKNKKLYAFYSGQCENTCTGGSQILTAAYEENDTLYVYTDYTDSNNGTTQIVYEFTKSGDNYLFEKVREEKAVE